METLDTETLRRLVAAAKLYEADLKTVGPQNDEELWQWIKDNMGIEIPRAAVCQDTDVPHNAPFQFLADLYFERVGSALAMANRGGGKTMNVALLHYINAMFKPGIECATFGAIDIQADKCYEHLKTWIYNDDGELKPELVDSLRKITNFRNGSIVRVLGSTPEQVNGPHPQKVHGDEIELVREDTWKESRNMSMSKKLKDGRVIKAQDILTSTRKGPRGRMQQLIDQIQEARRKNDIPPFELYAWCIFEDAAQVKNCRETPENADLPEFTGAEGQKKENCKCECNRYKMGFWDDGEDRSLDQVCKGKLYKSRGYKSYEDIANDFLQNPRYVWEAQIECSESREENLILPQFRRTKNVIKHFLPNPKNGPIYMAVDWGGTAANAVSWYQLLEFPVRALRQNDNFELKEFTIPANSLVCFDELYEPDWPPTKLGNAVHAKEDAWREKVGKQFRVENRFPDKQGRGARNEWAAMPRPLKTQWNAATDVEIQIAYLHELIDDGRFYVDEARCPMFIAEAESWKRDPNTNKEVREFNHQMSAFRYAVANIRVINNRILIKQMNAHHLPVASTAQEYQKSPIPVSVKNRPESTQHETWRDRYFAAQPDNNASVLDFPGR